MLRGPDWARTALIRRIAAGLLTLAAVALLLVPEDAPAETSVLVAVRDLAPGSTVAAADLAVRRWPTAQVPAGALHAVPDADGRVLAGAVRAGEALTDLRLIGPQLVVRAGGPDAAAVPLRPADPAVAALLAPGTVVDVVAPGDGAGGARVVAGRATVLSVLATAPGGPGRGTEGPLVLVALPQDVATEVAAASLAGELAVTLR
ncbi:Flp pilus assembly protein CpaB [Pseudonocardia endophytica]|uniref:Flp pilus assembly protein CpaB n=1 Tax=Pseudonocardia endophytica TaxID=401976 RepID=A0A4R1I2G8_PSEEN|nr:Flp pilus assembly protein CpaB [Pseudonocardia endophytica]